METFNRGESMTWTQADIFKKFSPAGTFLQIGKSILFTACFFVFSVGVSSQPSATMLAAKTLTVTESFRDRIRVLYLAKGAMHQHYYVLNFLERHTNLRFIYQRDCNPELSGDDESAAITDGILWDDASFPAKLKERTERLKNYLLRRQFDFIIMESRKFPPEIEKLLLDYVSSGGTLVWLGGATVEEGLLSRLCPFVSRKSAAGKQKEQSLEILEPDYPVFRSLPVEDMLKNLRHSPVEFKKEVIPFIQTRPDRYAIWGLLKVEKGFVWGCSFSPLIPCQHPLDRETGFDSDLLWAHFWEQTGRLWKNSPWLCQLRVIPSARTVSAGSGMQIEVEISGNFSKPLRAIFSLQDIRGENLISQSLLVKPQTKKISLPFTVPAWAPTGTYLVKVTAYSGEEVSRAYNLIKINGAVSVELTPDQYGISPDQQITFSSTILSQKDHLLKAHWFILNPFGRLVAYQEQPVAVFPETKNTLTFTWKMPDYGTEGWAFRTVFLLVDNAGKKWAEKDCWFWRYQPWTMREKFLFSNYWAGTSGVPAGMMPLFVRYHKSVGYNGGHTWQEPYYSRFNMRAWYQWSATMMEKFTNDFKTPDFSHLKETAENAFHRTHKTAAFVIQDFGEETGFYYHWSNNPFGRTWLEEKDIPEGAHKFFQLYLREKYTDITRLNTEWQTQYKDFSEVRFNPVYGYPSGWLFVKPPSSVPENIAPVLDTHGFFFWYTRKVAQTITENLQQLNPVSDWGMSFSLTFNLFSPIPMTMVHPVYHASVLAPWHDKALARSKNGSTPLFSFHWGFDEDRRVWGQFWNHSLAALSTFISNWGSQFHCDLTHSRSTIMLKRLLAKLRPREQFFLNCYPVEDFDVGIYHPDLDWQTVHSRPNFFLRSPGPEACNMGQLGFKPTGTGWLGGPEFQIYNVLNASGYVARFITEEQIPHCRVIVVPWVETMPETAAFKLRDFVQSGGLLITMPVLATHNGYGRPHQVVPGFPLNEVCGFTTDTKLIGQRCVLNLASCISTNWRFSPRPGSEPCYLWSFGHQKILGLAPDSQVPLKLYDGNPAIILHPYGQGRAIHLNMATFDHFSQYEFSPFQAESLRQLFDNLVQLQGISPFLRVENPLLYGQAVHDWVLYHYRLKDSPVRVLAIFSDRTSPTTTAEIVLRDRVEQVIDILNNQRLPLKERSARLTTEETDPFAFTKSVRATLPSGFCFPVKLEPAEVAFFAFIPFKTMPLKANLEKPVLLAGKDYLKITVEVTDEKGNLASDARPVHVDIEGPDGQILPEMCRRLSVKGKKVILLPLPLDSPEGTWTLKITDVVSGLQRRLFPRIHSRQYPAVNDIFYPSAEPSRIDISDTEFCHLLETLKDLYLKGATRDKVALSYYCLESDISRHRIMQLLLETDWLEKTAALKKHLSTGHTVILLGEDLGIDPVSQLPLETLRETKDDPSVDAAAGGKLPRGFSANILPALEQVTGIRNLYSRLKKEGCLLPVGRGRIYLDLTSFDEAGQENSLFLLHHHRWLQNLPQILKK